MLLLSRKVAGCVRPAGRQCCYTLLPTHDPVASLHGEQRFWIPSLPTPGSFFRQSGTCTTTHHHVCIRPSHSLLISPAQNKSVTRTRQRPKVPYVPSVPRTRDAL